MEEEDIAPPALRLVNFISEEQVFFFFLFALNF